MIWDFTQYAEKIALIDDYGNSVSYKELECYGQKIADVCAKRCLVFLMCKNQLGAVIGYSAFVNNKIVPVLLNSHLDRELLDNLIFTYYPKYIWVPKEQMDDYKKYDITLVYELYGYSLLETKFKLEYPLYNELCMLLTTSGSTGSPKFVRQSYKNVIYNAKSIVEYLELGEDERPITTLPMNYTYGLSIINSHFMVGATILLTDKGLMQKEFWNFMKSQSATSFGGVPYTYEMLMRLRFDKMDLPSLRYMTQAGGKLLPELHKTFAEYAVRNGKKFIIMYGQCEATARMGYLPATKTLEHCGSMGIAIPGGKFYLVDAHGNEITLPNVTGELVYEGKNVTLGYAECGEDLYKGDERRGVLQTGDMAQFDEDGYYYIVGRKKRFLKIYGNRINLDEVEQMINSHFNKLDCASTGKDDHLYLFITDATASESVKCFIAEKTKINPAAFKTIVINEIPKNDAGKILYKELTKYYD